MYLCISSLSEANILKEDLLKLEQLEEDLDMNFHPSKCQALHVTRLTDYPKNYFLIKLQSLFKTFISIIVQFAKSRFIC